MDKNKVYTKTFDVIQINPNLLVKKRLTFNELDAKPPTKSELVWLGFNYLLLIFWALIILFPVVSLLVASFNVNNPRIATVTPFKFGLDNLFYLFRYRNVDQLTAETVSSLESKNAATLSFFGTTYIYDDQTRSYFGDWYKNTLYIAGFTALIATIAVALNAYAYSRFKFAGSKHSLTIIMLIQMIPATSSLIVLYIIVQLGTDLKVSPILMLVLIYSGGAIAGNTFMVKSYLDTISTELDDSAKIDGCTNWGLFFKILLPIIRPALIMVALWSFLIPFTDILLPTLVLPNQQDKTLASGLQLFLSNQQDLQAGAYTMGTLLASLPAFILFMYLQKYIIGGLSDGAVKG
ncbi:sugar ABC transporter permease [[Mycoplasma] imitans]|uniref:sugar ABC transporter permease n=1 Tax=[Mycoplasma] imitans TaxID=29560 RepID=UPI00048045FE|nr:ABC transporter permease subunit [[Mycoplasma] imitans]